MRKLINALRSVWFVVTHAEEVGGAVARCAALERDLSAANESIAKLDDRIDDEVESLERSISDLDVPDDSHIEDLISKETSGLDDRVSDLERDAEDDERNEPTYATDDDLEALTDVVEALQLVVERIPGGHVAFVPDLAVDPEKVREALRLLGFKEVQ